MVTLLMWVAKAAELLSGLEVKSGCSKMLQNWFACLPLVLKDILGLRFIIVYFGTC